MKDKIRLRQIKGYPNYFVSDCGHIYSTRQYGKWMRPQVNTCGYLQIGLRNKKNQGKLYCVHKLVAATFLGENAERLEVNHIDGDKTNNKIENLEYVTRSENMIHCWRFRGDKL